MARRQCGDLCADAEQLADEVLQVWRDSDQQVGLLTRLQRARLGPRCQEPGSEIGVCCAQVIEKQRIQPEQAFAIVQIVERQAVGEVHREGGGGVGHGYKRSAPLLVRSGKNVEV